MKTKFVMIMLCMYFQLGAVMPTLASGVPDSFTKLRDPIAEDVMVWVTTNCHQLTYDIHWTPPVAAWMSESPSGRLREKSFSITLYLYLDDGSFYNTTVTIPTLKSCGINPPCGNCHLSNCTVSNIFAWPENASGVFNGGQWKVKLTPDGTSVIDMFNVLISLDGETITLDWEEQSLQIRIKDLQAVSQDRCVPLQE